MMHTLSNLIASMFLSVILLGACGQTGGRTLSEPLPKASGSRAPVVAVSEVNSDDPGQQYKIKNAIAFGKYTIIDFYSDGCSPCRELKPLLEGLTESRPDIVLRIFDVNRKNVDGIDWDSPLIHQYQIHSLPYLIIFNERGLQIAEGRSAKSQVFDAINKARNAKD